MPTKTFADRVIEWVEQIPAGKVATYGQIATLAGNPKASRAVASALRNRGTEQTPWHRVLNAKGQVSPGKSHRPAIQISLLTSEGVHFNKTGGLDLEVYRWEPAETGSIARVGKD